MVRANHDSSNWPLICSSHCLLLLWLVGVKTFLLAFRPTLEKRSIIVFKTGSSIMIWKKWTWITTRRKEADHLRNFRVLLTAMNITHWIRNKIELKASVLTPQVLKLKAFKVLYYKRCIGTIFKCQKTVIMMPHSEGENYFEFKIFKVLFYF